MNRQKKGLSAQDIFDLIENKWRVEYAANNNAVANGGIVATCVWFGQGDFLKTLNLACSAADYSDADCNAANSASVVGAMHGLKAIPPYLLNVLGDRIKGNSMGPNSIPAVDEKISTLAIRTTKVGTSLLAENGVKMLKNVLSIPSQLIITQPAELFDQNDLVRHWNANWKIANAMRSTYLEGDVLVTGPKVAPIGMYLYSSLTLDKQDSLKLTLAAENGKCWELKVLIDNDKVYSKTIESNSIAGKWQTINVDISKYHGKKVMLRLYQNVLIDGKYTGNAYWKKISII